MSPLTIGQVEKYIEDLPNEIFELGRVMQGLSKEDLEMLWRDRRPNMAKIETVQIDFLTDTWFKGNSLIEILIKCGCIRRIRNTQKGEEIWAIDTYYEEMVGAIISVVRSGMDNSEKEEIIERLFVKINDIESPFSKFFRQSQKQIEINLNTAILIIKSGIRKLNLDTRNFNEVLSIAGILYLQDVPMHNIGDKDNGFIKLAKRNDLTLKPTLELDLKSQYNIIATNAENNLATIAPSIANRINSRNSNSDLIYRAFKVIIFAQTIKYRLLAGELEKNPSYKLAFYALNFEINQIERSNLPLSTEDRVLLNKLLEVAKKFVPQIRMPVDTNTTKKPITPDTQGATPGAERQQLDDFDFDAFRQEAGEMTTDVDFEPEDDLPQSA